MNFYYGFVFEIIVIGTPFRGHTLIKKLKMGIIKYKIWESNN